MFGTLLESSARRRRRTRVAVVSLAAHVVAVALASAATRRPPSGPPEPPRDRNVIFEVQPEPPRPATSTPGGATGPKGTQAPPDHVLDHLSPIGPISVDPVDPTIGATAPGEPIDRPTPGSPLPGGGTVPPGGIYEVVERPAAVLPGAPVARYPESLRQASIEGETVLRFVVDTAGRVEPGTVSVVHTSHPLFADAARRAVLVTRYSPAEAGGHRVRQLVQQAYAFSIGR